MHGWGDFAEAVDEEYRVTASLYLPQLVGVCLVLGCVVPTFVLSNVLLAMNVHAMFYPWEIKIK